MRHKHRIELAEKIISCANALIIDYQIDYEEDVNWAIEMELNGIKFSESSHK